MIHSTSISLFFVGILYLASSQSVSAAVIVLTKACNTKYPGLQCGGSCEYACPFGFPCSSGTDCLSGGCDPAGYCALTAIVGNPKSTTTTTRVSTTTTTTTKPTMAATPTNTSSQSTRKLGDVCIAQSQCPSGTKCHYGRCQKHWEELDFSSGMFPNSVWNVVKYGFGPHLRTLSSNPVSSIKDTVLKVSYPAGSRNPQGPVMGGTGIYVNPMSLKGMSTVTLEFQVFFPTGFDFVKGGKLPGMYGGSVGCSGGSSATNCFSTRYMWRKAGDGEIYLYADKDAQVSNFCSILPNTVCNPVYGWSLGRGSWRFKTGAWNKVRQTITLNSFGSNGKPVPNGVMSVWFNDSPQPVLYMNQIVFRTKADINVDGIIIETFFGGSDKSFETPKNQVSYFRGFKISGY